VGHTGPVGSAAFSPDGTLVVTASEDGTARMWSVASGRSRYVLAGHAGTVESAAFSVDGNLLVTAGDDKTARIWDVSNGRRRHYRRPPAHPRRPPRAGLESRVQP